MYMYLCTCTCVHVCVGDLAEEVGGGTTVSHCLVFPVHFQHRECLYISAGVALHECSPTAMNEGGRHNG